jgi:hypothetical protein
MASVEVGEQGARPRMMAQVGLVVKEPEEVAEEVLMVRCFDLALEVGPVLKMVQARWGFRWKRRRSGAAGWYRMDVRSIS